MPLQTEVLTARNAQYSCYIVSFTIDYDIDGEGSEIEAGTLLGGRLRRVDVTGTEVDNEIFIMDWVIEYTINTPVSSW